MGMIEELVASARTGAERRRAQISLDDLQRRLDERPEQRPFGEALTRPGLSVIAEFKRRSPSAGEIRAGATPADIAGAYEDAGAAALSVLTDEQHFGGSLEDLREARAACELPVLQKDFTVDRYQLYEAALAGADAVLLIVAALGRERLSDLMAAASDLGMDSLVEVHDEGEVEVAVEAGAELIGINNRDLHSLEIDLGTTFRLLADVPAGTVVVAESGITARAHVADLEDAGIDAILVGEALMRADDPADAVRDLLG